MINIKIKSKSIFAVTLILALFLCIGLVSASDLSTDIDTISNSNDVKVVETNYMDDNVAESEDSASANDNSQTIEDEKGDFTSLNQTINSGEDTIVLDKDYEFNPITDAAFIKSGGIRVTKNITINGDKHTIDCGNAVRFLYSDGYNIILEDITIKNGYVPKSTNVAECCGGAVFIKNADLECNNVLFNYNYAYNRGGAVAILNGSGNFKNFSDLYCEFNHNSASYGGAVDIQGGYANFANAHFISNNALDYGGAIRISNSPNVSISNSIFTNNTCNETGRGGAIYLTDASEVQLLANNYYNNSAKYGGAIYSSNGYNTSTLFILEYDMFVGNFAEVAGGAVFVSNCIDARFRNLSFIENYGNYLGGAVYWQSTKGYLHQCNFEGNYLNDESPFRNYTSTSQKIGGAICIDGSDSNVFNVTNSTFKHNNASLYYGYGGAIALRNGNLNVTDNNTFDNNTLGDVVYTNGIYNGPDEYAESFARMDLTLPTGSIQYGTFVPITVTIPCVVSDIPRVGRVTITHGNQTIYTKYMNETNGTSFDIVLDYLPVGEHNYTLTFEGPNFDKMSQNFTLNIAENTHNYNFNIANITYGDNLTINVVDGTEHLDYGDIYVIVGTELYIGQVYNGTFTIPYTIPAGNYQGFIFLDPDFFKSTTNKPFNVTVAKKAISGTATAPAISYGEDAVVTVTLSENIDTLVYIQVSSKIFYGRITNGTGNITVSGLAAGSRNLSVRMVDTSFDATIPDVTVDVAPASTEIDMGPATFVINYAGTYTIKVLNVTTGVVNVTLAGKDLGTFKIADGVATISLTAAQLKAAGAGSKIISVVYAGDKNHNMSSGSAKLTINKEVSKFTNVKTTSSAYKSTAKSMKLTATLKDSKNKVIKNQAVIFKVNNKKSFSVKTNSKGVATLTLNAAKIKQCKLNKKGNYKFTVTYKTTATYKQATGTGKIKVTK